MHSVALSPDFTPCDNGQLFTLLFEGNDTSIASEAVLFVPPFAEEMNKSRKMMSQMLTLAAANGFAGYLFDLYGTGDSSGDFVEATWVTWKQNLQLMIDRICALSHIESLHIISLRTGALLLNDTLNSPNTDLHNNKIMSVHYWNPVFNATQFVNQFLRLRLAASMVRDTGDKLTVKDLRSQLELEQQLEVAGYMLSHSLIVEMESAQIALPEALNSIELFYYELNSMSAITPGLQKKISEVRVEQSNISTHGIEGAQFWSTQEISLCQALLDLTLTSLLKGKSGI